MKRRGVLAGGLAVTFLPGCALTGLAGIPVIPKRPAPNLKDAAAWVRYVAGPPARYVLFIPRVEMGQNILTALKQVACDELGVPWSQVEARLPSTQDIARVRATVGSDSVKDFALPLARACATLRNALAAGQTQGVLEAQALPMDQLRSFARSGSARYVGHAAPLEQGQAIVRGQPLYAGDVQRPGLLYGRVLRATASPELRSSVRALDEAAARTVPGFVALVRDPLLALGNSEGLGIVARTPGALDRIAAALSVQWSVDGSFEQADIDRAIDVDVLLEAGAPPHQVTKDRVDPGAPWNVDLRIDIPLAAHAPIEPRCAVAEFKDGALQLWVGSQDVFYQRDVMVKRLGLDEKQVTVHGMRVGGAFGGKTICTVELEAAVLSRVAQQPVKVQWTRAQEFQLGFHRPPSSHRIRARLKDGQLQAWWHVFASSHILFTNAALPPWIQRLTNFIGDDGVARGAALPYRAQAKRSEFYLQRLPVFTGPWRGLGAGPNVFAMESAIDECARKANADAVQFRLNHIDDPRLAQVLRQVAAAASWGSPRSPTQGNIQRGRGVACGIYKAMSYAAVVADVEVNTVTGTWRVRQLWCAHDCGTVINPDQVRAQCEGNLVWGLGMVLGDRLPVANGQVAATTFADAPIPLMKDVPPMTVLLVDDGQAPTGAGETAIVAAGAAIANAVRDATGWRPQRLPIAAQNVLVGMQQ